MPHNLSAQIRFQTIDRCLRQRRAKWTWKNLAEACGLAIREWQPQADNPSERTIKKDIQVMRSGALGYQAPIEVHEKKYYRYADPDFNIHRLPLQEKDLDYLRDMLQILPAFRHFEVTQEVEALISRVEALLQIRQSESSPRLLVQLDQLADAPGRQWFNPIYSHVRDRKALSLVYQPFDEAAFRLSLSPYLLKEYNKRWFVIGYDHRHHRIHTFPLDRILELDSDLLTPFYADPRFQPAYWYRHLVGVSMPYDAQPETVRLWVSPRRANYLRTKPLHQSQKEESASPDGVLFSYFLILNTEWEQLLLSFADEVKVLEPASLALKLKEKHEAAFRHYEAGEKNNSIK